MTTLAEPSEFAWMNEFKANGYATIENFASSEECDRLQGEMKRVLSELDISTEHKTVFSTRGNQQQLQDDYFLTSGDKVRYFFEKEALNDQGELVVGKDVCLNKVGHALHWHNQVFKDFSFSEKMKSLAKDFSLQDPAIIQSMYIFKNPRVGGEVCPHQDASFLWLDPLKLYGVWLALDDATEENGCLWFVPGSHKTEELHSNRRMMRVTKKMDEEGHHGLTFTGSIPEVEDSSYKACPVKRGTLVLIDGMVIHKSESNKSDKPRNAYTLHLIEQLNTKWSEGNWLQPTEALPFTPLFAN